MLEISVTKDAALVGFLADVKNFAESPKLHQAMLDMSEVGLSYVRRELINMVYSRPEHGYSRKMGAGLLGATQASGVVTVTNPREVVTAIVSHVFYAVYVFFGTGIYATKGRGRKTPWVYGDADGKFHYTVGQRPKPYMIVGLINGKPDMQAVLAKLFK